MHIKRILKIYIWICLIAPMVLFTASCQEPKNRDDFNNSKPVTNKYNERDEIVVKDGNKKFGTVLIKRLRAEEPEEDPAYRKTDPPIQIWFTPSKTDVDSPEVIFRWIQIVTNKCQPLRAEESYPHFDIPVPTKKEAKSIADKEKATPGYLNNNPAVKSTYEERKSRITNHNPFYKLRHLNKFRDAPWQTYDPFDTYIILCAIDIQTNPEKRWRARIVMVWHWQTNKGKKPTLESTSLKDKTFTDQLNDSRKDFDFGFSFDTWYDGDPP